MGLKHEDIIKQMSLEEKALMMSGKNVWETVGFEQYGIPSVVLSDGPHGLRRQAGSGDHLGLNASLPATCFPTAATVANSWDEKLGEKIGEALAKEAVTMGVNVILGPGLNIKRSPLCGRNFEYFSEDPYHAGKMAAAYIRGIQSQGISACPKHFAANSQELRRMANDSVVDERTLREIYTTGFEIAVREGKAKSIMTSYNEVNGVYASENEHLLQDILVEEWGFDGFVVTDWGGSNEHALGVKNGNHLEMPGTGKSGMVDILRGIRDRVLTEEELDQRLDELLDVILQIAPATKKAKGTSFDVEAHHALAKKAAGESIVLLKNEGNMLPLKKGTRVALIGDFAKTPRYQGAGSSLVNPTKTPESMVECIENSELECISYSQGYIRNKKTDDKLVHEAVAAAKQAEAVILCVGLDEVSESEGLDRTHMRMPSAHNELIRQVLAVNENTIIVISAGSSVEMPWFDQAKAILHGYLGGQAGASAMLDAIVGNINPCGKLNETYPMHYDDSPCFRYYPSKERSSEYREALYVGYRYFDTVGKQVRFPFGYGLSYTSFAYSDLQIDAEGVTFNIKNIGLVDGAEIAQLYIGKASDTVFRPKKELKGFAKVWLKAGEEKQVHIAFDDKTFRFFDTRTNTWEVEAGDYQVYVAKNVEEVCLQGQLYVKGTVEAGKYDRQLLPDYFTGQITQVEDEQYQTLYEKEIPDGSWSGEIRMNDAVCQLYYGKGIFGKLFYGVLKLMIKAGERSGKPNLNVLFNYNMPIRGYAKMTNGFVTMDMARALTEMANGHRIKGTGHLIKACFVRK